MRRMWAAGAVVLACLALGGTAVEVAAATPLDYNISVDSGAEAARGGTGGKVAIPGWKTSSLMTAVRYGAPGFPTRAQARKVQGESNVFYCGGATEESTARQKIAVSGRNSQIDAGKLALDLSVRIGSATNDGDSGVPDHPLPQRRRRAHRHVPDRHGGDEQRPAATHQGLGRGAAGHALAAGHPLWHGRGRHRLRRPLRQRQRAPRAPLGPGPAVIVGRSRVQA